MRLLESGQRTECSCERRMSDREQCDGQMPRRRKGRLAILSPVARLADALVARGVEALENRVLLSAGDPDPTFGLGGQAVLDFPGTSNDAAQHAQLQSDGKIVVLAGSRLARFSANGALDTTFGAGGSTLLADAPSAFAVRSDNKIVIASVADANSVLLTRYTANGLIDTTFGGGDGAVTQPVFGGAATTGKVMTKVLVQPVTNRIYIAGTASQYDSGNFALAAFNEDGTLYDQFGDSGQYTTLTDFGNVEFLSDATFAPNGDIIGVGSWFISDSHHPFYLEDYAVVRWDQSGIPVSSFSGDGKVTVGFGHSPLSDPPTIDTDSLFDSAQSVAIDAAGNIVIAGRSSDPQNDAVYYTSLARLKPDGSLDATFSPGGTEGDGRALVPLTVSGLNETNLVAIQSDGKILVATTAPGVNNDTDFALTRLNANGTTDTTFGKNGVVLTDLLYDNRPSSLLVQSGKALVVGGSYLPPAGSSSRLAMARYLTDNTTPPVRSPFGGTPVALPGTLQFENFDNGAEGIAYHDTDAVNQGGAYRTNTGVDLQTIPSGGVNLGFAKAGEWTEYTVNVQQAGDYDAAVRLASLKGGGTFRFVVDGNLSGSSVVVPSTGDWQKYTTVKVGPIHLTTGTHIIRLAMLSNDSTGYVANFDSAQFTVPSRSPFGGAPIDVPGVLQLENFDNGAEGVAYHDTDSVNQGGAYRTNTGVDIESIAPAKGGGYTLDFFKAGEWTEYTFNVPEGQAGAYNLYFWVASLRGNGVFRAQIDGKSISSAMGINSTGDWQTFRDYTTDYVSLTSGTHVLRLTGVQNDSTGFVGNFDRVEFKPRTKYFKGVPFSPSSIIQAEDFDIGGEGVTYHDTDPANVGGVYRPNEGVDIEAFPPYNAYSVSYAKAGEWLQYSVDNATSESVLSNLEVHVASLRAGGKFHVEVDGAQRLDFTVPDTGSWQTYTVIGNMQPLSFSPGMHTLRLVMDQNNSTGYVANFDYLQLVPW